MRPSEPHPVRRAALLAARPAARRLACAAAVAACAALLAGCGGSTSHAAGGGSFNIAAAPDDPVDFGRVPDFALTSQKGEQVTLASLAGRPFVLSAVFTRCTGPCPSITANMQRLQAELADTGVLLVTLSVDPGFDTPQVLRAYAEEHGADEERWLFLTGPEEEVYALLRGGFRLAVDRATPGQEVPGQEVTHATKLVAVDGQGRIRGFYDGRSDAGREDLQERMKAIAREKP
jgi:cytochrome oxidase Cu insertion factor (SCO1/SenC/PrrC family)